MLIGRSALETHPFNTLRGSAVTVLVGLVWPAAYGG